VLEEIDADLGLDPFEAVLCSAKTGEGIDEVLEAIVSKLPPPGRPRGARSKRWSSTPSTTPTAAW
jgi:translation elongation factor EF-4